MVKMMTVRLGDIIKTNQKTYSPNEKWKFVNYLDTGNITENKIDKIQYIDISTDKLPSRAKRKVERDSIIYSTVRPNQKHYGIIRNQPENFLVSTGFVVIDVDKDKAVPDYIYYILSQHEIIDYLQAIAEQGVSAYPSLKPIDIENLQVSLPDLDIQRKVVSLLSVIEGKIFQNITINNNLEKQAQVIFEHMFPNINLGKKCIGDMVIPKRGKTLISRNTISGNVPVVAGGIEPSVYHNTANTTPPVLTISASGANAGYVSLWNIPVWASDSSYIDATMTKDVYFWYVLLKKRQKEIFEMQTGSAQPHIYPQHIASMSMAEIKSTEISEYSAIVTPIFKKIGITIAENVYLVNLQRILLPKLMSGQLDISKIRL
jgi:type I restriction enzyme S subunit